MNRILVTLLLLSLTGCASTKQTQKVHVTNAARKPLTGVSLASGPTRLGQWETLPGSTSRSVEGLPPSLLVSWTDADGKAHRVDTRLKEHVPPGFSSDVYVQIEPDNRVNVKLGVARRKAESDMPWTKPESWEGAPNIPGLNQD